MRKIDSLTGLRFFAALAVFMLHVQGPEGLRGTVVDTFIQSGAVGVTLFFVLSGFVLAWTYADRLAAPTGLPIRDFAVARLARIMPLYLAALLFVVLQHVKPIPEHWWLHPFGLQTWSGNLDIAFGLNTPGWTIGVELFLYALCPLILWLVVPLSGRQLVFVLAGSVVVLTALTLAMYAIGATELPPTDPGSASRWLFRTPLTRVPDFLVGVALALLVMRSKGPNRWAPAVQWGSLVVVLLLMTSKTVYQSAFFYDLAYLVPFGALIWSLAMAERTKMARFLASRLVVRGGLISYAFYLFHAPILDAVVLDPGLVRTWILSTAGALMLSLLAATGAHLAIEVPAQRWLRHRLSSRGSRDLPVVLSAEPSTVPEPRA